MSNRTPCHRIIAYATVLSVVLLAACCALGVTPASNPQTQPASGPFKVVPPRGAKPLPCGVNVPTHKVYQDAENRWYQNHVVEAYQKLGRRNPAWDDTVVQMLNMTGSLIDVDFPVAQAQASLANKAIDAGCDDALVLFHHARAQRIGGAVTSADFRQAIQALRQSPYPKSLTSWAMVWLYGRLAQDQKEEEAAELEGQLLDDLCAAIRSGDFEPDQKRVLLHYVESGLQYMKTSKATLYQRIAAMEDGEPWVCQMVAGKLCIDMAWEARGGGWAYKVTQEGWEGFRKNMATARQHLLKACELSPEAPEGPSAMIPLAMADPAGPNDTPRYWFDRTVASQFNYMPAYSSLLWSLRPRWGGSHDAMYELGLECVATQRYDTNVPWQLLEALHGIADDYQNDWGEVLSNESIYQQVQQMLDGYLRTGQDRGKVLSTKLGLAVLGSRWEDAAKLLSQLSGPPSEEALAYLATNAHEVMKAIEAHKMPQAQAIQQADSLAQKGDFGQAQKVLQQALNETKDPEQQTTLRFRLRCAQQQEQFHDGKWVELLAGEDLVEWTPAAGQWKPTAPGEIEGIADQDGLLATCRVPFSLPLEITGQVEFVHTPYALSNAAVLVCPLPRLAKAKVFPGNSIIIFRSEKKVFADFDNHDIEPNTPLVGAFEAPVKKTTDFDILLWPEQVSVKINDKWITEKKPIDVQWGFKSDVGIGIGGRYWYAEPKLRFRNLKVRRLAAETP